MNSLSSLFTSRKTIRVFLGIIIVIGGLYFMWPTFNTADAKMKAFVGAIVTIGGLLGVDVLGIAHEDAATKAGPQTQTNVNSDVTNQPIASAPSTPSVPPPPPPPPPFTPEQTEALKQIMAAAIAPYIRKPAPPVPQPITNTGV